jgi:polysaccharide biosynthesis transport protein
MTEPASRPSDLAAVTRTLRRRIRLVALCALLLPAAAFGFSLLQDEQYEATASVVFRESEADEMILGDDIFEAPSDQEFLAQTNAALANVEAVRARTAAGVGLTREQVYDKVRVERRRESLLIDVTATDGDPESARRLAQVFADQIVGFQRDKDREAARSVVRAVRRELATLDPVEARGPRGTELRRRAERLEKLEPLLTGDVWVVEPAKRPTEPSSPKPIRSLILGLVLGPLVGVGLALLVDRFDRRLKEPEELEAIFGQPVLARVPQTVAIAGAARYGTLPPREAEPFRALRMDLWHRGPERSADSVLIASPASGDGRTTVAWYLAAAAARGGLNALLIEADLRQPTLAAKLDQAVAPGLGDVLDGTTALQQAVRHVSVNAASSEETPAVAVGVVVAGPPLQDPADLIDSHRMRMLIEEAERDYDLVVVDSPPSSLAADAVALSTTVSGVVVVGRVGHTPRRAAIELRDHLRRVESKVLGVVVNRAGRVRERRRLRTETSERVELAQGAVQAPSSR